jgi:hypothetical protein
MMDIRMAFAFGRLVGQFDLYAGEIPREFVLICTLRLHIRRISRCIARIIELLIACGTATAIAIVIVGVVRFLRTSIREHRRIAHAWELERCAIALAQNTRQIGGAVHIVCTTRTRPQAQAFCQITRHRTRSTEHTAPSE